jgi:hypothetical protein
MKNPAASSGVSTHRERTTPQAAQYRPLLPSAGVKPRAAAALTWDGARWPAHRLPAKARAFLGKPTAPAKLAALLAEKTPHELRICWVPRLKGGSETLSPPFPAPHEKRIPYRLIRTTAFGTILGAVYRHASK